MVNSTTCPLCKDGIGHAMDDAHAKIVKELLAALKQTREALAASITPDGDNRRYAQAMNVSAQAIAKAEAQS